MYSKKIETLLSRKKISVGDRIRVEKSKKVYEGLLMPKTEFSDPKTIVIKLDSGYNIGVSYGKGVKLSKLKGKSSGKSLGKVDKSLTRISFDPTKPPISMITTGGTVASRVNYEIGGVIAVSSPKEILHNIAELANIVNIRNMSSPINKMSEDMGPADWIEIAKAVAKSLNSSDKGVIVTHGTDFLHYTSAALSFFLRDLNKPVVLVGSQRSSDRGSSDAGMNIICAAYAAISDIAEVGVCMHGEMSDTFCMLNRGTKVRKMHTSRRDAFRPVNELPLAKIWPQGKILELNKDFRRRSGGKVRLDTRFEPRVAILKVYPGADPDVIDYYISKGYKGFVLEVPGLGHAPTPSAKKAWTPVVKKHVKDGIPFVSAPQTLYGRINPDVYTNLRILYRDAGAIPGEDMLPETAYIKLGWVLGHTRDPEKVREMMTTNYAGEITKRTLPGAFLY
jgi:glutamyl-tRNA(Gln) amidotransferase subunit D